MAENSEPAARPDDAANPSRDVDTEPRDVDTEPREGKRTEQTDADAAAASQGDTSDVEAVAKGGRLIGLTRLLAPRASGATALIALLIGLLGFALIAQVNSNSNASTLSSDRPDDLVRILSDLDARKDRLNSEISSLRATQTKLQSGAQGRRAALAEATKRADELGILAGAVAAQGPGLRITLLQGANPIGAVDVLDTVEELRDAGAEAMQIGSDSGVTVRIIASTYFADSQDGVVVDGQTLGGVLTVIVIGDPQTMQTALSIPGGAVDTIKQHGGNVLMAPESKVRVTALHPVTTAQYAHPVS